MSLRLKNYTPHDIVIVRDGGEDVVISPEPVPIRVAVEVRSEAASELIRHGKKRFTVPMKSLRYGRADLPEEEKDVLLIVSDMVREAHPERFDLVSPGDLVRDSNGKPVGCRSLIRSGGFQGAVARA